LTQSGHFRSILPSCPTGKRSNLLSCKKLRKRSNLKGDSREIEFVSLPIVDVPGQDFLRGGGEMGALTRAYDWAKTPLGRRLAAKSKNRGSPFAYQPTPDVHLVGTGADPIL
jgi:hypothetical protein